MITRLKCALFLSLTLSFIGVRAFAGQAPAPWVEIGQPRIDFERSLLRIDVQGTPGYYCRIEISNDPVGEDWRVFFNFVLQDQVSPAAIPFALLEIDQPAYVRCIVTPTDEVDPF